MPKQSDDLTQPGDDQQRTKKGLRIPVPTKEQISDALRKASRPQPDTEKGRKTQQPDP